MENLTEHNLRLLLAHVVKNHRDTLPRADQEWLAYLIARATDSEFISEADLARVSQIRAWCAGNRAALRSLG